MLKNAILKTALKSQRLFLAYSHISQWGQSQRADLISKADYIQGQDVVIFNELFDKKHPIDF